MPTVRLRATAALRTLARETALSAHDLVLPLFVAEGGVTPPAGETLQGLERLELASAVSRARRAAELGIAAVLVFGVVARTDPAGKRAADPQGPAQRAITAIRERVGEIAVIADTCLCAYTTHGHCWLTTPAGTLDLDSTVEAHTAAALSQAAAGAHLVAPSGMVDGLVSEIRLALDLGGHRGTGILAYSTKYASALYGPFRDAAGSGLPEGHHRRGYQLDPANAREGLAEAEDDEAEGADALMVKPAGFYLDVIARLRERTDLPVFAYQVSGEAAMLRAAADRGWIDEKAATLEALVAIRRAGADRVITYRALEVAEWLS